LLNVRGVSRSWRAAADTLIWQSLIASPRLFDAPLSPMTIQNLEEDITLCSWFQDGLNRQQTLDYVTFSLDEGRRFDRDLAKVFTEALLKCKRACVEIDLNSPPGWSTNHHLGASDPSIIPLHQFLWKSNYLGIGNCIPSKFYFPWPNLRDGIPWSQLTTLYLDCPLSIDDARHVLSEGRMTLERASLSYIAPNDSGTMGDNDERPRHPPIYAAELKLIVHHLFSLTIHTCVDLTPLFSSFVFQSLKHLDLRVRGQLPHDTPPLLDHNLDIPWAGLMSLSLFSNNNMDPCLIHPILIKCRKLRRFEWYGDLTDFPVSGSIPFSDLPPFLEEVKLHSDGPGLDILIQTFSNLPVMAKMPVVEISAFHRLLHHQEPYRSVTHLSLTSTLGELFLILRSWRETLVSGDFTIEGCTTDQLQMGGISCRTLKHFGISSPTRLESLWKVFFAPVLENLHISLEGLDFSLSEIPPFLRSGKPSVFRIGRQEQLEFGAVVRTLDWDKSLT
jgi:hypothetical protein